MFIGKRLTDDTPFEIKPAHLTTHGLCVGMTGSGKTGLCVTLIEEARRAGIPSLVIDPKGDMANLALAFDDLAPEDFAPWVSAGDAQKTGKTRKAFAADTATRWRDGLAADGLHPADIRAMNERSPITIFTPGSTAGEPLNILAGLAAPDTDDPETKNALLKTAVNALLGLVGVESNPLTGREFILLSNILDYCWERGEETSLERIIAYVQNPPLKRIGVFALDSFYPASDRLALALKLNGLMASPTFRLWLTGAPLSMETLLRTPDGRPRTSVLYLAHLPEPERMFVISLVTSRLVAWMRTQTGTEDLRVLLYIDEVVGMMPPHPHNPPSKHPLLTLFKQARAFGVGVVVATQNPMDVDYKVFANAGFWLVGRLATENDRRRVVEGLKGATGVPDDLPAVLASLEKRRFFVRNVRGESATIRSRFAMSYLRGPLTKADVARLTGTDEKTAPPPPAPKAEGLLQAPNVTGVNRHFLVAAALRDPEIAAAFRASVPTGKTTPLYRPALYVSCQVRYDDTKAGLLYDETVSRVVFPLDEGGDRTAFDDAPPLPDLDSFLDSTPPTEARFQPLPTALDETKDFDAARRAFVDYLAQKCALPLFHNEKLRLYSRPGESEAEFVDRCRTAADEKAQAELEKTQKKHKRTLDRLEKKKMRLEARVDDAQEESKERQMENVAGMLETAAGFLFGRRRSVGRAVSRTMSKRRMTSKARRRQERYAEELEELLEETEGLREELDETEEKIAAEFDEFAARVAPYPVPAERADIRPVATAIIWIPTW